MKKSRRKEGKWRKCPECGAEIYHGCQSCAIKKSTPRTWKCLICGNRCAKHHYQRFCTTCFEDPINSEVVEEARQERSRRFRVPVDRQEREPSSEEVEALIAKMLPTMPKGDSPPANSYDQRDGRKLLPPKPRKRTAWGNRDVITALIDRTSGGFTRALLMADEWLQKQDPEQYEPVSARSELGGEVVTIRLRNISTGKILKQRFATADCQRLAETETRRKEGRRDSRLYRTVTAVWHAMKSRKQEEEPACTA